MIQGKRDKMLREPQGSKQVKGNNDPRTADRVQPPSQPVVKGPSLGRTDA